MNEVLHVLEMKYFIQELFGHFLLHLLHFIHYFSNKNVNVLIFTYFWYVISKMFVRLLVLVMRLGPDMYIPHSFVILPHQHRSSHSPLSFIVHEVFVQAFTLIRMPLVSHSEVLNEWTKWTTWSTSCQCTWTNEVIHSDEVKITSYSIYARTPENVTNIQYSPILWESTYMWFRLNILVWLWAWPRIWLWVRALSSNEYCIWTSVWVWLWVRMNMNVSVRLNISMTESISTKMSEYEHKY